MDAYKATFGQHIRYLRRLRSLTQEEVAHRAGVHVTYLSGIERGVRNPSLKNIRAIAEALGVPMWELFAPEPVASEPLSPESVVFEPLSPEPLVSEPLSPEPLVSEPLSPEPLVSEPLSPEPLVSESLSPEPLVSESLSPEPLVSESLSPEPVVSESLSPEPVSLAADATPTEISSAAFIDSPVSEANPIYPAPES